MVKKKGSQPQRDNFVMIPRIISSLGLSPFAYRLYAEIKDVAGEGGKCFQSTRTLATSCGMSIGQISEAKRELVRAALILVQKNGPGRGRGHVDEIVVVDVWHENHAMYHQEVANEQARSWGFTITSGYEHTWEDLPSPR